ncbi:MAG: DNA-processing protein DprA [Minisyncoccota bacterium]
MNTPSRKILPSEFPARLLEINDPPKSLWVQGTLPPMDGAVLCVVGSRKATSYGRDACRFLLEGLANSGTVIVSGLALGIDAIAHETALGIGLPAVAVPGSGLDDNVLYPQQNMGLAKRILAAGGALISEYEPTTHAALWTFPKRNRIMAGLSQAVLIIEAEEKSGTLITARLALDYNRDVFAVPGGITAATARGTNMLIRQGATPVTSPDDLLEALGFPRRADASARRAPETLSAHEREILDLLREPCTRDELIRTLGRPHHESIALLSAMEINGLIKEEFGVIRTAFES